MLRCIESSSLAKLAYELGFTVSGSELNKSSEVFSWFRSRNCRLYSQHARSNVFKNSTVVFSSAISKHNPELHDLDDSCQLWHRSDLLNYFEWVVFPGLFFSKSKAFIDLYLWDNASDCNKELSVGCAVLIESCWIKFCNEFCGSGRTGIWHCLRFAVCQDSCCLPTNGLPSLAQYLTVFTCRQYCDSYLPQYSVPEFAMPERGIKSALGYPNTSQ